MYNISQRLETRTRLNFLQSFKLEFDSFSSKCACRISLCNKKSIYLNFSIKGIELRVSAFCHFQTRSELFNGIGENTGGCLTVSCPMIEFVLVDSPNCPGASDGRNPWGYLASRLGNCACGPVRSRSRHRNPGKKDTSVFHPD